MNISSSIKLNILCVTCLILKLNSLNNIFVKFSIEKILAHLHIAVVIYNPVYITILHT